MVTYNNSGLHEVTEVIVLNSVNCKRPRSVLHPIVMNIYDVFLGDSIRSNTRDLEYFQLFL